jgi:hypothetical protein
LMSIHITHHTYNIALTKKPFENIFYLRNSPVQPLSGKKWYGRACMILWCHGRGWKPPLTASQIHIECIQSVWAPWDTVYGPMGASLCVIRLQVGVENGVWLSLYDFAMSWLRLKHPLTASHIHIGCIQSVLALEML